jgi:predicted DNA-binding transcriptional regulator AlpA
MSNPTLFPNDPLLTESEAAEALNCSVHTLRRRRKDGKGPKRVQVGDKVFRYRMSSLRAYVEENTEAQ